MKIVTRKRLVAAGWVAAFLGTIAGLGAVSKSTAVTATTTTTGPATPGPVPSSIWYWTMAVSASDPNVLVLGSGNGLYRSTDGGKTWQPAGPKNFNATSVVGAGSTMLAGGVDLNPKAPIAVIRKGLGRTASDGKSVLAASTDDGKTWKVQHPKGLPNVSIQSLAVDPASSSTVYALLNTGGLYRSTDTAASFRLVSKNIGISPWAIGVTKDGAFVSGDMDAGPHTSSDAKAWQKTPFKDARGGRMVMEYAVKPDDSTLILMSSFGVVSSTDGGKTWHTSLKSSVMFGPVAWAPSQPNTAYAIGFDSSLFRTDDGGKTWSKV